MWLDKSEKKNEERKKKLLTFIGKRAHSEWQGNWGKMNYV